jgi:hypothetical protein
VYYADFQGNYVLDQYQNHSIISRDDAMTLIRNVPLDHDSNEVENFRLIFFIPSRKYQSYRFLIHDNLMMDTLLVSDRDVMVLPNIPETIESSGPDEIRLDAATLVPYWDSLKKAWFRFIGVSHPTWIDEKVRLKEEYKPMLLKHIIRRNINHTKQQWSLLRKLHEIAQFIPDKELVEMVGRVISSALFPYSFSHIDWPISESNSSDRLSRVIPKSNVRSRQPILWKQCTVHVREPC